MLAFPTLRGGILYSLCIYSQGCVVTQGQCNGDPPLQQPCDACVHVIFLKINPLRHRRARAPNYYSVLIPRERTYQEIESLTEHTAQVHAVDGYEFGEDGERKQQGNEDM